MAGTGGRPSTAVHGLIKHQTLRPGVPRDPPLATTTGLKDALLQLRRERLLSFTVEGDVARVTYGDRIREIAAAEWGLVLPPAS